MRRDASIIEMEWFGLLDFFRFWERFSAIFALQFIPRKGTETTLLTDGDTLTVLAIYTPQGDGNCFAKYLTVLLNGIAIYTP